MNIDTIINEFHICKADPTQQRVDNLLCQMIQYIINKDYLFLLERTFPWEQIESTHKISDGSLIITSTPFTDGFLLLKTIPMRELLANSISTPLEEISLEQRLQYIAKIIPLIPCFD